MGIILNTNLFLSSIAYGLLLTRKSITPLIIKEAIDSPG
jgi:hypothetical protein